MMQNYNYIKISTNIWLLSKNQFYIFFVILKNYLRFKKTKNIRLSYLYFEQKMKRSTYYNSIRKLINYGILSKEKNNSYYYIENSNLSILIQNKFFEFMNFFENNIKTLKLYFFLISFSEKQLEKEKELFKYSFFIKKHLRFRTTEEIQKSLNFLKNLNLIDYRINTNKLYYIIKDLNQKQGEENMKNKEIKQENNFEDNQEIAEQEKSDDVYQEFLNDLNKCETKEHIYKILSLYLKRKLEKGVKDKIYYDVQQKLNKYKKEKAKKNIKEEVDIKQLSNLKSINNIDITYQDKIDAMIEFGVIAQNDDELKNFYKRMFKVQQ